MEHGDALVAQPLDVGAVGRVGALHRVAEIVQHLGDAGHADAADADEVDGAEFARAVSCGRLLVGLDRPGDAAVTSVGQALGAHRGCRRCLAACAARRQACRDRRAAPRSSAASRSGVKSSLGDHGRRADGFQRRGVGRLVAVERCGSGTRIDGRPMTASSATVEAPERATTRCAAAMRAGRSREEGRDLGRDAEAGIGLAHALRDPPRAPAARWRGARALGRRAAATAPAARCRSSPARPGCRRTRRAGERRPAASGANGMSRRLEHGGRTGLPVMHAAWPRAARAMPLHRGKAGGDGLRRAARASGWRGRARRSARG